MVLYSQPKYIPKPKKLRKPIKVANTLHLSSLNNNLWIAFFNYFPLLQAKHFMTLMKFIVAKLSQYNFCHQESRVIHHSYKPIKLKFLTGEIISVFPQHYIQKTLGAVPRTQLALNKCSYYRSQYFASQLYPYHKRFSKQIVTKTTKLYAWRKRHKLLKIHLFPSYLFIEYPDTPRCSENLKEICSHYL